MLPTRKSPRKLTQTSLSTTTSTTASVEGEEGVKPCVCDGCGEVVPDCSWLTAHIVVCPGMTGGLTEGGDDNEEMIMSQDSSQSSMTVVPTSEEVSKKVEVKEEEEQSFDISSIADTSSCHISAAAIEQQQQQLQQLQQQQEQQLQQHHIATMNTMEELKSVILGQQMNSATNPPISISNATSVIIQNPKSSVSTPVQFGLEATHDDSPYCHFEVNSCGVCGLTFYTEEALLNHSKSSEHHQSHKQDLFSCLSCGLNFHSKEALTFHFKFVCKEAADEEGDGDESMEYRCWLCHKVFISELFLAKHTLSKHTDDSSILGALQIQLAHKRKQEQLLQQQLHFNKLTSEYNNLFQLNNNGNNSTNPLTTIDASHLSADFYMQASSNSIVFPPSNILVSSNLLPSASNPKQQQQQQQQLTNITPLSSTNNIINNPNQDLLYSLQQQHDLATSNASVTKASDSTDKLDGQEATSITPTIDHSLSEGNSKRPAKGIMYKNVYMQCIVNYHCSQCNTDLSTKQMKKEHRRSACFDQNSNR